jgi:F-type H+-transporting ATPase subunit epsilon
MAHTKFRVEVLTPEGQVFDDEVEQVSTMTAVGSIGILAGHQPLLGMAEPAPLRLYRSETDVVTLAQGEGYIQVAEGNVLILVEEALDPGELNAGELQDQIKEAEGRLSAASEDSEEYRLASRDKRRWEAFLEIAQA